ncbi:hypothetical protein ACFV98_35030 [Streptomyces violascens]|uniref:hypothetical protein n=1 Tax=Streptomyces violascens TaxID=67381 RepID=UPI00364F9C2B
MSALFHPRIGEGPVLLVVTLAAVSELVAVRLAPSGIRPAVSGFLLGAAVAVLAMTALLSHRRRRIAARHHPVVSTELVDESWFTARTLDGFPVEDVRPRLLGPDAPDLHRLYAAWILAPYGWDTAWIGHQLGLPHDIAALLVGAARARHES